MAEEVSHSAAHLKHEAATTIQALMRGRLSRKFMHVVATHHAAETCGAASLRQEHAAPDTVVSADANPFGSEA